MFAEPQQEHRWLDRMVGEWTFTNECFMGPDQPPMTSKGTEVVRSLGGLWVIAEGEGEVPGGSGTSRSIMSLGYDPATGRYVGTFLASVMTHLWLYDGSVEADGKVLALGADGPSFTGEGTSRYVDSIEFIDDNHRTLTSKVLGDDGNWVTFMTAHYHRK